MSQREIQASLTRRRRGKVLELLRACEPHAIADAQDLYRLLQDVGETLTLDDLVTLLRDLKGRDCVKFNAAYDPRRPLPVISLIRLTPRGRDVLDGSVNDAGIDAR